MAWETRGNGRYYYRKIRVGNQVFSDYYGNGETAVLIAQLDAIEREQKEAERQAFKQVKADNREMDKKLDEIGRLVRETVAAVLVANGYHTHKGRMALCTKSNSVLSIMTHMICYLLLTKTIQPMKKYRHSNSY